MADYISREAAVKILRKSEALYRKAMKSQVRADMIGHCIRLIGEVHAADVRPVVRGKWEKRHTGNGWDDWDVYKCSVCGKTYERISQPNYCPNCGADMREQGAEGGA